MNKMSLCLPWEVTDHGDIINHMGEKVATCFWFSSKVDHAQLQANAAAIVKAVNAHAELVRVLETLNAMGGLGYQAHNMIESALAKCREK